MKFHVVDHWCGVIGGEDYGAVPTYEEAAAAVRAQIARGNKGGCRCTHQRQRGWSVVPCVERHGATGPCYPYHEKSFGELMEEPE